MPVKSSAVEPLATAFLLIEARKSDGEPVWAAKWRSADGERVRRRLGAIAWVARDADGGWRARDGRPGLGALSEFQARRRMAAVIERVERERSEARARTAAEAELGACADRSFRSLAHAWLAHTRDVRGAKPSTMRDYGSLLAEPGVPYRRGKRRTIGRVMAALGDLPAAKVTTAQIEAVLAAHARDGVGARSVNKHRQILCAIFKFGLRSDNATRWGLTENPAVAAAKRRENGPARLEVFTVEEIEAIARAAESGAWRGPREHTTAAGELQRAEEDAQLADLLRLAAYTGLRRGELIALRWRDVRWEEHVLVVERSVSGDVEGPTKGRRVRYVPLADQALAALDRLSRRPNFTSGDDYVFCGAAGDRIDSSAVRRRYIRARDAAGAPPLRFHDLRHTAGTLLTRVLDPITVRDVLGHADLKTTERYLHAVKASRLADAATQAFTPARATPPSGDARATFLAAVAKLGPDEARRLLAVA